MMTPNDTSSDNTTNPYGISSINMMAYMRYNIECNELYQNLSPPKNPCCFRESALVAKPTDITNASTINGISVISDRSIK